jgi:flagellar motor switch protein FliG
MKVFENILRMSDDNIQQWLRKVGNGKEELLINALIITDNNIKNRIFKNMSNHAVNVIKRKIDEKVNAKISNEAINDSIRELETLF